MLTHIDADGLEKESEFVDVNGGNAEIENQ